MVGCIQPGRHCCLSRACVRVNALGPNQFRSELWCCGWGWSVPQLGDQQDVSVCPSLSFTNFQFLVPSGSFHPVRFASAMAPLEHHTSMRACRPFQILQQYHHRVSLVLGLHGDSRLGGLEYLWSSPILPETSVSPAIKCSGVGTCVSLPILTA